MPEPTASPDTPSPALTDDARAMIRGWVEMDRGDPERTARWMARQLRVGGIRECRRMVREALGES